ncbi:MAG: hypothetical protein DRO06_02840 [Thermoproteota archaeon]|nr:MAG: hypothetical protein DRO06_02840 [Candidatus Korarchaeota archaeon]
MSLEERLARVEALLERVVKRLEALEEMLGGDPAAQEAVWVALLAVSMNRDAASSFRRFLTAWRALSSRGMVDDVSRAVVQALALMGPMNISQLTRAVRRIRGRASRRIVAERVRRLEDAGVLKRVRKGRGSVYDLSD